MTYHIYTDGSCRQSCCGFGVVGLFDKKMLFAHQEQCQNSTNNREELKAIIAAIQAAQRDPANEYIIYSDSSYCVKSINEWMPQWYQKNWINSKKKEVENIDFIYFALADSHKVNPQKGESKDLYWMSREEILQSDNNKEHIRIMALEALESCNEDE